MRSLETRPNNLPVELTTFIRREAELARASQVLPVHRRSPIEWADRDVRAGTFHPLPPEKTLHFAGRLALGLPVDEIW